MTRLKEIQQYDFTELADATSGVVNVIGVVKFFKPPSKTRGTGYMMALGITDPSLYPPGLSVDSDHSKLMCNIFNDRQDHLPQVEAPGDVVILHRLKVSVFNGKPQGQGLPSTGFAAAVFSGRLDAALKPRIASKVFNMTQADLDKVKALITWYHSPECPLEKEEQVVASPLDSVPLSEIRSNLFFNLDAQIVSILTYPDGDPCVVVRVWDASLLQVTLHRLQSDHERRLLPTARHAAHLLARTEGWTVDVFVYDDHVAEVAHFAPGDKVRFVNLHAAHCRNMNAAPGTLELDLHGGKRHGRGVFPVPSTSNLGQRLASPGVGNKVHSKILRADIAQLTQVTLSELTSPEIDTSRLYHVTARVIQVHPEGSPEQKLETALYHVCSKCRKMLPRSSSAPVCCSQTPSLCPVIHLVLEDPTAWLLVRVLGVQVDRFLGPDSARTLPLLKGKVIEAVVAVVRGPKFTVQDTEMILPTRTDQELAPS